MDRYTAQREVMIVRSDTGLPIIDLDPIDVWATPAPDDVASCWDERLSDILDVADEWNDATGVDCHLVFTDTGDIVKVTCPACDDTQNAREFVEADDDDCVVCLTCL